MPREYLAIAVLITLATGLSFLVVILGHLFGPRRPNVVKGAPYESGMRPYGEGQRRVPIHFYLVAVLFILFDIEIVFILPWAVVLKDFVSQDLGAFMLIEMGVFIFILLVGYLYAWKAGALEWE